MTPHRGLGGKPTGAALLAELDQRCFPGEMPQHCCQLRAFEATWGAVHEQLQVCCVGVAARVLAAGQPTHAAINAGTAPERAETRVRVDTPTGVHRRVSAAAKPSFNMREHSGVHRRACQARADARCVHGNTRRPPARVPQSAGGAERAGTRSLSRTHAAAGRHCAAARAAPWARRSRRPP